MTGFYFDAYCIFGIIPSKVEGDWNTNIFNNWQEMDRSVYVCIRAFYSHFMITDEKITLAQGKYVSETRVW